MNLVIDVGNTRVKAAVYEEDTLCEIVVFSKNKFLSEIKKIIKNYKISNAIISSVALISSKKIEKLQKLVPLLQVSAQLKMPFKNLYATPHTLGVDRIALTFAAAMKYPTQNVLIIDAGTCITYDFLNHKNEYLGGAISPGLAMRYKSLHTFTSKLPLLPINQPNSFIGNSTNESINAGIVCGVLHEIDGIITQYKEKYLDLTVILTGGDTNFLSKQLKSSIFATQNFLLEGLNEILIFNINK